MEHGSFDIIDRYENQYRYETHNLDPARCASPPSRLTITPSISTCSAVINCVHHAVASRLSASQKKKWGSLAFRRVVLHAFVFCPRVGNCRVFLSRLDLCKRSYSFPPRVIVFNLLDLICVLLRVKKKNDARSHDSAPDPKRQKLFILEISFTDLLCT